MEAIALPLSFLVLVWVFGGLVAAALPLAVGGFAIFGSMAVLRAITFATDVSIFALNLSVAMGLALAIDYTLLIISRFRDELGSGVGRDEALVRTMATAGRTVLFSAITVALSMSAMVLFPMYFLKSFAYAGIAVVAFAATAALVVTPAAIALLGKRLDSLDVRRLGRRLLRRPQPGQRPVEQTFWYRLAKFVMRRAVPIGLAIVALLVALGAPFLGVKWGVPDDRVLPTSSSARQVGDQLRTDFAHDLATDVTVVIPRAAGVTAAELGRYAARLSQVPDVSSVSAPGGTFVAGSPVGPPSAATAMKDGSAFLTVASSAPLFSPASEMQLDRLHAVPGPGGEHVLMTGTAQINRDTAQAVTSRLPIVLAVIAAITFVLLFLLTGSVVLPLKALVLNVLSLTAAFGALVWIFQDGHLGALGTTATGTLVVNMPVLLFCIAFGLSMDYEVFLVSRIREYWLASNRTRADNDESVALGLAHTGRVITAAALIMSISFAALIAAHVSFMRMFGLGLTLAVLMDATLVRMLLVPAFMHVMGRFNWWAPKLPSGSINEIGYDFGTGSVPWQSAGYPPPAAPDTSRGQQYGTTITPQFSTWDDAPSKLSRYLLAAVVILGLAGYLVGFGPLWKSPGMGSMRASYATGGSLAVLVPVLAALMAAVALAPKQRNRTAIVAVVAVVGFLLAISELINTPRFLSVGWALMVIVILGGLQAVAAIGALLLEAGIIALAPPRPMYDRFPQYGRPGRYYGQPGQQPAPPPRYSPYGGYQSGGTRFRWRGQ
jgi:RND superfamily putative drug exporter